ncbi:MAG TPA: GntR family transcriptional regulator [Tepidisphaeraceae bacterium]|jgi:DNA-binding GntR family transcriptional regulator|nr:GntR family transcriptional regulator [Tepidisphaeraceae bacterium]
MLNTFKSLSPLERGTTLRSDTTACLVRAVLKGDLKQGDKLVVRKLAEHLGVSATPVREAIVELEAIGILEVPPNQSAVIRKFGPQELFEIYHLRGLLETEATRLSCNRIPQERLAKSKGEIGELLKESHSAGTPQWMAKALEQDRLLHRIVAHYCGLGRLFHEIGRYTKLMEVISEAVGNEHNGLLQMLKDHQRIVEAMLMRDPEIASRRMGEHIHTSALNDIGVLYGPAAVEQVKNPNPVMQAFL